MSKQHQGRLAIDWIKDQYLAGRFFANTPALRDALVAEANVRSNKAHTSAVLEWDRQARYELASAYLFVTPPVKPLDYSRAPNAVSATRRTSLVTRKRYLNTAIRNLTTMQAAAAAQFDASRTEIQDEIELRLALSLLERIRERIDAPA